MKLKISLFKKALIANDLKRFWWISALYAIVLLIMLPLNHFMQKMDGTPENLQWLKEIVRHDLLFVNKSIHILLLIVPVIIGVLVFRYMQKNSSASLFYSLPVTRTSLYLNSIVSSVILFVSPLLIAALAMFLLNGFSFLSSCYSAGLIMTWLLNSLLFGLLILSITVLVGMFTGNSIAQLAFVYILNILPVFLYEFTRMQLSVLLYGFDTPSGSRFYDFIPMFMLYFNRVKLLTVPAIIIYIILILAFFAAGLTAFKLRKPEAAGDIITFKPVRPLFVYGVTLCGMLLSGIYYGRMPHMIIGYFISSLIFYIAAQMISNKSIKIWHTYKGYIGYALILAALLLGIRFDISGYVNKVPDPASVEEAYIGYNLSYWLNKDDPSHVYIKGDFHDTVFYKTFENIEKTTELHRLILKNKSTDGYSVNIAYKLKNGNRLIRQYTLDTDLYAPALEPIYESREYKEERFPILYQEVEDLKYIEIKDSREEKNPFIVSDKAKLESFKTAIRKDIEALKYEQILAQSQRVVYIRIFDTANGFASYELRTSFSNTLKWLKKEGIYDQVVLKPESLASVTLESPYYTGSGSNKSIEITDKAVIQEILDLSFDAGPREKAPDYNVYFPKNPGSYMSQQRYPIHLERKISPELQSYIDKIK